MWCARLLPPNTDHIDFVARDMPGHRPLPLREGRGGGGRGEQGGAFSVSLAPLAREGGLAGLLLLSASLCLLSHSHIYR